MKRTLFSMSVVAGTLLVGAVASAACGGATAERAKEDVKSTGNDLGNGVGTNGKNLEDGVGTKTTDGGTHSGGGDKK